MFLSVVEFCFGLLSAIFFSKREQTMRIISCGCLKGAGTIENSLIGMTKNVAA